MTFYFKVKIIYLLKHYYKKNHLKAILFIQSYVYFNCEKSIKSSKNGHIKFLKLLVNCCGKKYILYLLLAPRCNVRILYPGYLSIGIKETSTIAANGIFFVFELLTIHTSSISFLIVTLTFAPI